MANTPILDLPVAVSLTGSEYTAVVQGGTTKRAQASLFDFTGGSGGGVQSANTVYSGPASGAAAPPTFRALVAADFTGTVWPVSQGGTGLSSYTIGDLIFADGMTSLAKLADVATGNALISGGVGVAPSWGKIDLTTTVSGILPVTNGGTGSGTASGAFDAIAPTTTQGDLIYRNATTNTRLAASTSGYHLQTNGAGTDPTWVGFTQTGTGAVARTWQSKGTDFATPLDFGCAADGVTDDGTKLQAWIAAGQTAGIDNFDLAGRTYATSVPLTLTGAGSCIHDGNLVALSGAWGSNAPVVHLNGTQQTADNIRITCGQFASGIKVSGYQCNVINCNLDGFPDFGIYVTAQGCVVQNNEGYQWAFGSSESTTAGTRTAKGIWVDRSDAKVTNNTFFICLYPLYVGDGGVTGTYTANHFWDAATTLITTYSGYLHATATGCTFIGQYYDTGTFLLNTTALSIIGGKIVWQASLTQSDAVFEFVASQPSDTFSRFSCSGLQGTVGEPTYIYKLTASGGNSWVPSQTLMNTAGLTTATSSFGIGALSTRSGDTSPLTVTASAATASRVTFLDTGTTTTVDVGTIADDFYIRANGTRAKFEGGADNTYLTLSNIFNAGTMGLLFTDLAGNSRFDVQVGSATGNVTLALNGTAEFSLTSTAFSPSTSDGNALGTSSLMWSDLFLASGGVINFNAGNYTLTHSAGLLTASGAFSVGTSNAITAGTIELGAATDTTLARSSAGNVTIEGNLIYRVGGTDVAVADGGTGLSSGTSGGILGYTASGTLASSVALTASAIVLGGGAGATPTPMGSLGTTTTVLHGNAAGAPTFGAVSLTADVSGTLPITNGGTGGTTALLAARALGIYYTAAYSTAVISHTGSTGETVKLTLAVPANIGANARIKFDMLYGKVGTAGTLTWKLYYGATGSGTGGTALATSSLGASTNLQSHAIQYIVNQNATNVQIANTYNTQGGWGAGATAPAAAVDTTSASEITLTLNLSNAGDTGRIDSYTLEILPLS